MAPKSPYCTCNTTPCNCQSPFSIKVNYLDQNSCFNCREKTTCSCHMITSTYILSPSYSPNPNNYGWICPTCKSVYAPCVYKCANCPQQYYYSVGTTTGDEENIKEKKKEE